MPFLASVRPHGKNLQVKELVFAASRLSLANLAYYLSIITYRSFDGRY
jgi:hypothetical protein